MGVRKESLQITKCQYGNPYNCYSLAHGGFVPEKPS